MSLARARPFTRGLRGPTPIFKRRHKRFTAVTAASGTPTRLQTITIRETGTIYAAKVGIWGHSVSASAGDIQQCDFGLACSIKDQNIIDLSDDAEVETMNGFFVGTIFTADIATTTNEPIGGMFIQEKFRFRRKCDENNVVELFTDTTVHNGVARTVAFSGYLDLIIRVR